jgi:hypothetical protein
MTSFSTLFWRRECRFAGFLTFLPVSEALLDDREALVRDGDPGWREWQTGDFGEFGRRAVEYFCEKFQKDEGFIGTEHVSVPEQNPLYRFTLFSRNARAKDFWNKILKIDEKGQRNLPL